ncbi:MAG: NYN domain-containing protein [Candidatus Berkelbacteria bacterium]|nr:NYN domain-containing protein [Candidatus Berkelbacteria bacterium]
MRTKSKLHSRENKPKIYAFIDSQNLNLGVLSQNWKLDFGSFRKFLEDKYSVSKAFLFIGFIARNKSLYSKLKKDGYILVFKPVLEGKIKGQKQIKGNVDAELVLHTMIEYPNYDQAIIVSGDGDFYCLIDYLKKKNKLLKIITPNKRYSSLLRGFSNFIVPIVLFKDKLKQNQKRGIPAG